MKHRQYPKVTTRIPDGAQVSGRWVATEKIHGANLVIATDGQRVRIGKRKAWLAEDEAFFGWQRLRHQLEAGARAIHHELGEAGLIRVYGELFGGAYPHRDVPAVPGVSAVQTGVWYAPDLRFAAFDVLVEPAGDAPAEMLAHRQVEALARVAGLLVVPALGRGGRAELERLPVRYPSRMAALLKLPEIADNHAEGYVLKIDRRCAPGERPTLKHKIPEFDELRYRGSQPFAPNQRLTREQLVAIGASMINPPRLDSARSKLGQVGERALVEEVVFDVLIDLETVYPTAFAALGSSEDALRADLMKCAQDALGAR